MRKFECRMRPQGSLCKRGGRGQWLAGNHVFLAGSRMSSVIGKASTNKGVLICLLPLEVGRPVNYQTMCPQAIEERVYDPMSLPGDPVCVHMQEEGGDQLNQRRETLWPNYRFATKLLRLCHMGRVPNRESVGSFQLLWSRWSPSRKDRTSCRSLCYIFQWRQGVRWDVAFLTQWELWILGIPAGQDLASLRSEVSHIR